MWLVICLTQLRMRRILERETPERLTVRMWLFPWLTYATIGMIVFVLGYMFYDPDGREQIVLSVVAARPWCWPSACFWTGAGRGTGTRPRRPGPARSSQRGTTQQGGARTEPVRAPASCASGAAYAPLSRGGRPASRRWAARPWPARP